MAYIYIIITLAIYSQPFVFQIQVLSTKGLLHCRGIIEALLIKVYKEKTYSKSLKKGYCFTYNSMCDKIGNPQVGENEILLLQTAKEVINRCH